MGIDELLSYSALTCGNETVRGTDGQLPPCLCLPLVSSVPRSSPSPRAEAPAFPRAAAVGHRATSPMSSHKGSAAAQGGGAPASTRATDTVELAELGPLLEETGRRKTATPPKVRGLDLVPRCTSHLHL